MYIAQLILFFATNLIMTSSAFAFNNITEKSFYGLAAEQGLRKTMEDAHDVYCDGIYTFFGLFDGHGGKYVADYAAEYLDKNILRACANQKSKNLVSAIQDGFKTTHEELDEKLSNQTGSTALVAIFLKNTKLKSLTLYIANAGDSRAVISKKGDAFALSIDHKPDRKDELERITKLNGYVKIYGVPRVNGILAISRALGDRYLNPFVTYKPEIFKYKIESDHEFLILACDGIWDVMNNQEAVDIVKASMEKDKDCYKAANNLITKALSKGSRDNVSAFVIDLKSYYFAI